ncbi:MAG TPA: hypothetical protein VF608_13505 [Thermoanaerobaculia bacterium]
MTTGSERTKAILRVLQRGREEKLATFVLKIFSASTLDECLATYETLGKAERESLDAALSQYAENSGAAFLLSVENEERR